VSKEFLFVRFLYECVFYYLAGADFELTPTQAGILSDAVHQVREVVSRVATEHRELHSSVSKVGKAIDRVGMIVNIVLELSVVLKEIVFLNRTSTRILGLLLEMDYFRGSGLKFLPKWFANICTDKECWMLVMGCVK